MTIAEPSPAPEAHLIENVPALDWRTSGSVTFAGALAAATAVTIHPLSYHEVMGLTGLAFRTRWYRGNGVVRPDELWCPSSPVGEFPEEVDRFQKQTGWVLEGDAAWDQPGAMARAMPRITQSVDAGMPVLGYFGSMDVGVAVGYEGGGATLLAYTYMAKERPLRLPPNQIGPWVAFLVRHDAAPPADVQLGEAVDAALANWQRQAPHHAGRKGEYLYGQSAITQWTQDLAEVDQHEEKLRRSLFFVNWWTFQCLACSRQAAAQFLTQRLADLGPEAMPHLEAARDLYGQEAALLGAPLRTHEAFTGPWTRWKFEDWSPEMRQREIAILREAMQIEEQAIAALRAARPQL